MSEQNDKLNFFIKGTRHKPNVMLILFISSLLTLIFCLESLSYFGVAEAFGKAIYSNHGNQEGEAIPNIFFAVDKKVPWFTPLIFIYIPWPFIWFIALPAVIYFAGGRHAFLKYSIISIAMYLTSIFIYAAFPTTCSPYMYWGHYPTPLTPIAPEREGFQWYDICASGGHFINDPLYPIFKWLMGEPGNENVNNVFGSLPSFHNFWAALLVFFGIRHGTKLKFRVPMITVGLLISLSTLMVHQHNLIDIIATYGLTMLFWLADEWFRWSMRLDYWVNHKLNQHPVNSKGLGNRLGVIGTIMSIPVYGICLLFMFTSLQTSSWYSVWYTCLIYTLLAVWFFVEIKLIMNSKRIHLPRDPKTKPVRI